MFSCSDSDCDMHGESPSYPFIVSKWYIDTATISDESCTDRSPYSIGILHVHRVSKIRLFIFE